MKTLKESDIHVGGFYVRAKCLENQAHLPTPRFPAWIREITSEDNDWYVHWEMYDPRDQQYLGSGYCSKAALVDWAAREATLEEIQAVDWNAIKLQQGYVTNRLKLKAFNTLSDDDLLLELELRGYNTTNLKKDDK